MIEQKSELELALEELYDLRKKKIRLEREHSEEAMKVKHEIRMMAHMLNDGFDDITVILSECESIEWDCHAKRILYHNGERSQFIEAASPDVLLKVRPYLRELVARAREHI